MEIMDEIVCLNCKETVAAGENCKCTFSGNNDQQYSLPRLDAFDPTNAEDIKEKVEYLFTSVGNNRKLCFDFQQIQMKDYENVKLPTNENKKEARLSSDLNRIRKSSLLTDETRSIQSFQNQYGPPISSSKFVKQDVYSDKFSFRDSTKHFKPKTKFWRSWEIKKVASPVSEDRELMSKKKNCSSFFLEEKLPQICYRTASQKTNLGNNYFSSTANFSIDTSVLPVKKKAYNNINEISNGSLTDSINFPKVTLQPVQETNSLVEKVSESTEPKKDAKNVLGPSEDHSDFIKSQNKNSNGIISFNDKLERYKRIETLSKPFFCNISKKRFTVNSTLNDHYRTHTKEKPYVCDTCGKVFSHRSGLVYHNRTHTGEKPYECDICKKAFRQKCNLISHKRIHSDGLPFVCDFCEKRFSYRISLVVHRLTHPREKPYECDNSR